MASIHKVGTGWRIRWRDPDGSARSRTVPSQAAARQLAREIEECVALGRRWAPVDAAPIPLILGVDTDGQPVGLLSDYVEAHRGRWAAGTIRNYNRMLRDFARFLKRDTGASRLTVDLLTRGAIERWWGALTVDEGLTTGSAVNAISAVTKAWEWGYESDEYGAHVPRPRRITTPGREHAPGRAPSWEQMDAVIGAAGDLRDRSATELEAGAWEWRRRLLVVLRCTGLRVGQAMRLTWAHVDLGAGEALVSGDLGKSRRERSGRRIPLAPVLLEQLAGWGRREGYLLAPSKQVRESRGEAIAVAWEASGVPRGVWAPEIGRAKADPHHAFRKGFKSGLAGLGVESSVRSYLVGHSRGIDEVYEDLAGVAREAVALVPAIGGAGRVVELSRGRS